MHKTNTPANITIINTCFYSISSSIISPPLLHTEVSKSSSHWQQEWGQSVLWSVGLICGCIVDLAQSHWHKYTISTQQRYLSLTTRTGLLILNHLKTRWENFTSIFIGDDLNTRELSIRNILEHIFTLFCDFCQLKVCKLFN